MQSRSFDQNTRIDPIYPKDVALARNEILSTTSKEKYEAKNFEQFVYDIEYFVNVDNYTTINQDRDHIFFEEISYSAPSTNDYQDLLDIRGLVLNDVATILANTALPSASKWLDVINVSASSDGQTIYCLIGTGVNFDPCPGPNCPDAELQELATLFEETSGGNSCVLPSQDFFPPTTEYIDMSCAQDFYGALDFARDFTNRGEYINGKLEPAVCNPVDPSIFTDVTDIPRSNLRLRGNQSYGYDGSAPVYPNFCFGEFPMYNFDPTSSNCSDDSAFCIPEIEAHYIMQDGIGKAISDINPIPGDFGVKFYCTVYYDLTFVTSGFYRSDLAALYSAM